MLLRRFVDFQQRHAWRELDAVDRIWATSDLHAEHDANMAFINSLKGYERDALVAFQRIDERQVGVVLSVQVGGRPEAVDRVELAPCVLLLPSCEAAQKRVVRNRAGR